MIGSFRVLHRGRRAPLLAGEVARLLSQKSLSNEKRDKPSRTDLSALFARIKAKAPGAAWSVAELRQWGFIAPGAGHRLGHDLAKLVRDGGRIGPFELQRIGRDNLGAIWQLR